MGILRTDKISGLETPTAAVTGSVYFDGSDDSLTLPDSCGFDSSTSYTVEMWVKDVEVPSGSSPFFTFGASGATNQTFNIDYTSAGNLRLDYYSNAVDFPVDLNDGNWHHIAATYDGTTRRLFADGYLGASDTTTNGAYVADNVRVGRMNWISRFAKCYISNLRVVTGTALYTSDFTVPTHALEVIDGTILLCCNNKDNAAAIDHANIGVSKSITVNGGAAVSTLSPSLTRDFTSGTEFKGVTTFDTQGYFVPPSGTTTDRDRSGTRAFSLGGYYTPVNYIDDIYYINVESTGNSLVFGELGLGVNHVNAGTSDSTRGISAGGSNPAGRVDNIEFITMASTGNSIDFGGDLTDARYGIAPGSNGTRGIFAGGNIGPAGPSVTDIIDYITIQSTGVDAQDFGDLQTARQYPAGSACSSTRHVIVAGQEGSTTVNTIDYITMSTLGNGSNFGDLSNDIRNQNCGGISSSSVRGIIMGGSNGSSITDHIEYITIATLGNSQDFGNLPSTGSNAGNTSSKTRAIRMGNASPSYLNTISYVQIASTGDAMDFGDLNATVAYQAACSNGHGGLS